MAKPRAVKPPRDVVKTPAKQPDVVKENKHPVVPRKQSKAPSIEGKYGIYQESWAEKWTNYSHNPDIHRFENTEKKCSLCDPDVDGFKK